MSDLKPCHYCGGEVAYLRFIMQEADVFCPDCNANGPVCDSEEEAIAAWNARTIDPAAIREAALREAMVALDRIVDGYALREDFRAEEIAMRCHATILALIDKPAPDHSAGAGNMIDKEGAEA